ncbi:TonB-dependent receptor [Pedobacter metabolipauper]|uniref:TonB-linked SusC/RagA family outer membrane protein n=1 Tax=Pedobacter metabolipauper TaxID=425513 RepID=A0A4R6SWW9_9SPHI|nr:TonB-dependent receptor [Pedobacter metabolipauper]TDQ08652.1 TonB-linked SusC/RagA family outer membrane protein [Pedobacter metabolipauper]
MKRSKSIIFFAIFLWLGTAKQSFGQSFLKNLVHVNLKDQKLKEAFSQLNKQTNVVFLYADLEELNKKVNVNMEEIPLQNALNQLLTAHSLTYELDGNKILIQKTKAIRNTLKGTVVDELQKPLPGVTVKVKGKSMVTSTNTEGEFSLTTDNIQETLTFSYIGFITVEKLVHSNALSNIRMKADENSLDNVVVVGYGTQLKEQITGSIATISGKEIQKSQVGTFTEAMAGKLPGVQISQITGVPGAAPSIRIRGTGSITAGNEPLYVVDGFPLGKEALSNFNMGDIESVSVLKDASSTSIYGSRGANGVIIVTTKRGEQERTNLTLSSYFGIQQISKKLDLLSPDEFIDFAIESRNNAWEYLGGKRDDPNSLRSPLYQISPFFTDKDSWVITNWQDEIFDIAPVRDHQLSVSGGSNTLRYLVSGGYYGQDGIIRNSDFKRYSLRTNIDAQPYKNLNVSGSINTTIVNQKNAQDEGQFGNGIIGSMINFPGIFGGQNADGSYPSFRGFGYGVSEVPNPLEFINEYNDKTKQFRTIANLSAQLKLAKGLSVKSMIGIDYNLSQNNTFINGYKYNVPNNPNHVSGTTIPSGSYESLSDLNWLSENTINYNFKLGNNHNFETLGGFTAQKASIEGAGITATNFPNNLVPTLNAGQITGASTSRSEWSLLSYLARANYNYGDRYFASATIRTDGSSRFGDNKRWGIFPSLSVGWMLSNEEFFDVSWINFLKLRSSFGLSGNNEISNYGSIGLLSYSDYIIGGNLVSGISPATLSNKNLSWERSEQFDIGVDIGLLKNRINLVVDAYQRVNNNLLLNVSVPSILGVSNSLQNIGKVRNRGLEISLNTKNTTGKFSWNTELNISTNRNIVLALGPKGDPIISSSNGVSHITEIGKPIGNFLGYIFDGVYNTVQEVNDHPHISTDAPGDPMVRDVNGDGKITSDDRTILGNNQPDFIYGVNNNFSYGSFDLGIMIQGVQGADIMNLGMRQSMSMTGRTNNLGIARDRWRSAEQPGNGSVFKAITDVRGVRRDASSFYMQDGSFLRVRNITLGYNFTSSLTKKLGLSAARIYAAAQNPFTFTNKNYLGYNPEVSSYHNALTPGVDYFNYPLSKTYSLGLNITF